MCKINRTNIILYKDAINNFNWFKQDIDFQAKHKSKVFTCYGKNYRPIVKKKVVLIKTSC